MTATLTRPRIWSAIVDAEHGNVPVSSDCALRLEACGAIYWCRDHGCWHVELGHEDAYARREGPFACMT